ncbi:MAG: extracellular solute-binding protein [Anaerolineae bacterium]
MNRRNRSLLLIALVLIVILLALAGCSEPMSCEQPSSCEQPPEWGENIITLVVGALNGSVAHRSEPYVIVMPDGRQLPAPAVGAEFTVAVDAAGSFTVQARTAPESIAVYEPDGVTPAFSVPQEKEVITPFEGKPSLPIPITPVEPSDTIRPAVPCSIAIAPEFEERLDAYPDLLLALGCPIGEPLETWAAEEQFQNGRMFWQEDTLQIHIVYDIGTFQIEPDRYVEGDPEDACPDVGEAPEGLIKPVRGFNWHWCNTPGVRDALGWALEREMGYDAVWQELEHGHVLQSRLNDIFIFRDDGTWDYVPGDIATPVTPPPPISPEEAELEIWHPWAGEPVEKMLLAAVELFHAQHPQVEVRLAGMSWGELMDKYPASAAAGTAPDVVLVGNDAAFAWAAQGLIQSLDDIEEQGLLADVYPTALDTLRYEGQLWGVPFRASIVALYYNRELFDEQGVEPPSTTDDLRVMLQEGYTTLALPEHINYTYGFLEGYGGRLVDEEGNVVVEGEGTYAYLKFVRDLVWSGNVRYGPTGEVQPLFQDYEAAMIIDGVWMLPAYRESLGDALGVTLLPQVAETGRWPAPILATDACMVSVTASDAEREAAVAFALFLTGEEIQGMVIQDASRLPVSTRITIDDPLLAVFAEQAKLASAGILHPDRGAIVEIGRRMLEQVILEEWSPEEATKNAAAELYEVGLGQ